MATLREYFDTDFNRLLNAAHELSGQGPTGAFTTSPRVHFDFDANALFISCFVPAELPAGPVCVALLTDVDLILAAIKGVEVVSGHPGSDPEDALSSSTLKFTGRVFLYSESDLTDSESAAISAVANSRQLIPVIRTPRYASQRSSWEKPHAFVSHDSRDKDEVARPIAQGLAKRLCPVWYDEFSLRVGDRLRESIERGLRECRKCILVVSPNFLTNTGWTKTEFNAVFTRELHEQQDVLLPVWHGVTKKDVYEYSPMLADRYALTWGSGEDEVVRKLHAAIISAGV